MMSITPFFSCSSLLWPTSPFILPRTSDGVERERVMEVAIKWGDGAGSWVRVLSDFVNASNDINTVTPTEDLKGSREAEQTGSHKSTHRHWHDNWHTDINTGCMHNKVTLHHINTQWHCITFIQTGKHRSWDWQFQMLLIPEGLAFKVAELLPIRGQIYISGSEPRSAWGTTAELFYRSIPPLLGKPSAVEFRSTISLPAPQPQKAPCGITSRNEQYLRRGLPHSWPP